MGGVVCSTPIMALQLLSRKLEAASISATVPGVHSSSGCLMIDSLLSGRVMRNQVGCSFLERWNGSRPQPPASSRTSWGGAALLWSWLLALWVCVLSQVQLCDPMGCSLPGSSPWNFPGKNTGAGCHFLLQGIFIIQGSNLYLLHWQVDSLPLSHLGSLWQGSV